jgi:pimeloyl-ACP methyl ester carboxylesterase
MRSVTVHGRRLSWSEMGDADGTPVIAMHGTAASHRQFALADGEAARHGIRLLALDRPGYGDSDFHEGRGLLHAASEVAAVADEVGIDRFGVVGISAGGPNALAVAHEVGARLLGVSVLSCVGPRQWPEARGGMLVAARIAFTLARCRPPLDQALLAPLLALGRRRPEAAVGLRARGLPPADQRIIRRDDVWQLYEDEARHAAPTAARAAAQDLRMLVDDWCFAPTDVACTVDLFHGTEDHEAPLCQAEALASSLPGARLHRHRDAGHLAFVDCLGPAVRAAAGQLAGSVDCVP